MGNSNWQRFWLFYFGASLALLLLVGTSLLIGSGAITADRAWQVWWSPDGSTESEIVHGLRWPRALVAIAVGASLAVAGTLMQSLTRNPLADPGILGINAGASLAVVACVATFGMMSVERYMWAAIVGAGAAGLAVHALGSSGTSRLGPARLALAGIAVSAAVSAAVQVVILLDQVTFNEFRFWVAGSLEGRDLTVLATVAPFLVIGTAIAMWLAPSLNALALGDEIGTSLGVNAKNARRWAMLAITLLCGASTAAVGPIGFVGLGVPFLARAMVGSDQRKVLPLAMVLGPIVLLIADLIARVVIAPQETQVGIITALLGGPLFIAIVRRPRIEAV